MHRFAAALSLHAAALIALVPSPPLRAGSSSQLALSADGRWLVTANIDSDSVGVVDTGARRMVREVPVGQRPECAAFAGGSMEALVSLYKEDAVAVVDVREGAVRRKIRVGDEPYGVVCDRSGTRAYVSLDYPGAVVELELPSGAIRRTIPIGGFARGLALSADERRLLVTEFHTAALVIVDLEKGAVAERLEGSPSDNLSRQVALHPTRPKAYLPHLRSRVTNPHGEGSIFPFLTVVSLDPEAERRRSPIAMDTFNGFTAVSNPWEAAVSPDGRRLYAVYSGTNDLHVCEVLDDDYRELSRVALAGVGNHPRAVAVSPDSSTVYVYDTLDFQVRVIDAETLETAALVPCATRTKSPAWVRGKVLFNSALQPMVGRRWISCSSCHPDGQADARTWHNPEGLRNTTALAAMKDTHPLHWSADRDETQDFEHTIRGPLMQGRGLIRGPVRPELGEPNRGLSADLDALEEYSSSFEPTLSPHAAGPGKLTPAAERGKALFFREDVGCAKCHSGPTYSDGALEPRPFRLHDVGTGGDDDSERLGPGYDTPTLLGVYRTAPYLHHGKARTLREVLVEQNRGDRHGKTSHLSQGEIDDLVELLKSLPYELPETRAF
ncbi:MAG: c-type cytochrome [Planctomycetes bacterium]|nr:c-type cytochrome [Planctomycetota bacterium]